MTNPYRANSDTASSTPSHGCVVCRTRAAMARVNWLRIATWVVAGTLPMISVASATLAYASVTMNARMIAAAETLAATSARKYRAVKAPPPAPAPVYPAPNAAEVCSTLEREVSREVLLAAVNEDAPLGPRIVPEQLNGRVIGLGLYGIREGSGLAELGLMNGDLVRSVNGLEIGSPEKALEVYERARTADEIVVELSRRGVPRELRLHVQDLNRKGPILRSK